MTLHAFRADGEPTLYGVGTLADARKYESLLNRNRDKPYRVDKATDGETALFAGKIFLIKQQTVRLLLGKESGVARSNHATGSIPG